MIVWVTSSTIAIATCEDSAALASLHTRDPDPDRLPVLADVPLLVLIGGALAVEELLKETLGDVHVLGVGERGEAHPHELPGVVAEQPLDRGVGLDRPAVGPDADDADRGALEQHPEALVLARVGPPHGRLYRSVNRFT